jgi:hypothetical protein
MRNNQTILIVGTSQIALDYIKILTYLNFDVIVVGRKNEKINLIKYKYPNVTCYAGGIENYCIKNKNLPNFAINTVDIVNLFNVSNILIRNNIKNILIEKPGSITSEELKDLINLKNIYNTNIYIGYNRRFYNSVLELKRLINTDGGIRNVHFEFTEWVDTINTNSFHPITLNKWIYSNSSHVIDLVFYIIGFPKILHSFTSGENKISWHKSASIFFGSGISIENTPFTYNTNWLSSGRWCIEFMTEKNRYTLKPMEKLYVQKINSLDINELSFDNQDDINFKPGLFKQVSDFLNYKFENLVSLDYQIQNFYFFNKIGNY